MNPAVTSFKEALFGNTRVVTLEDSASLLPIDAPSILEQTNWPCGFYSFPDESEMVEYFNCGLVEWKGFRWLVTRCCKSGFMKPKKNSIVIWRLDDNVPKFPHEVKFSKQFPKEEHEDARAINRNGNIILSYCNFIQGKSYAHQCICGLDEGLNAIRPMHIIYGDNGKSVMTNSGHEKNWVWFEHDGRLHFVYSTYPHEVVKTQDCKMVEVYTSEPHVPEWLFGEIRGGTPPVRVGEEYFSFFHSSIPWNNGKRRYLMGCYAFEAKPPFKLTRLTRQPLLVGSEHDPRKDNMPIVVFPQGSLFDGEDWMVTLGVNDCRCGFIKIPHSDLIELLK